MNDFKAQLMLCDYVSMSEGKLYVNGGGWTWIKVGIPFGIAALVNIPWTHANRAIRFELRLVRQDGEPVFQTSNEGQLPILVSDTFEVGRPAGLRPGSDLVVPIAFNFAPLPLPPNERLRWDFLLEGRVIASTSFDSRGE